MISETSLFRQVGPAIRLLRDLKGLSQAELARKAGIGKSQLSKYESAKEYPKLDSLEKILEVLGVRHFYFFYVVDFLDRLKKGGGKVDALRLLDGPLGPLASVSEEEALSGFVNSLIRLFLAKADDRLATLAAASEKKRRAEKLDG